MELKLLRRYWGVTVNDEKNFQVIFDPVHGYRRLEPLPDDEELGRFYQSQYYHLIRQGGRAPTLRRLMAGAEQEEFEKSWLQTTLYADIGYVLGQSAPGHSVLDIGCGTGEFLGYLKENGFDPVGIEPSAEATANVEAKGYTVYNFTLEEFVDYHKATGLDAFDTVTLLNVLEHVPQPIKLIEMCKTILKPGGLICLVVPNDYSEIQLAAQEKLDEPPWWVAVPDHINYFDFQSLHTLLKELGFTIIYSQGDFPMELFLLMGDNYIGDPEIGGLCHQKRVSFETAIPGHLRRRMYQALAAVGVGRNCLTFGRLDKQ